MERRLRAERRAAEIVERLNKEINAGLADPTFKARLAEMGAWPLPDRPPKPRS